MREFRDCKIALYSIFIIFLLILSGCAGFMPPARKHVLEPNSAYWFDYDASRRGTFLFPDNTKVKFCAEPSPDVALQIIERFLFKVPIEKIPVGGEADISQLIHELAGRTQTILFLRESLYRLCELSINNNFTKDEIKELYEKVIEVSLKLAEADLTRARADYQKYTARLFKLRQDLLQKINTIVDCVEKDGKVDKEKLENITKDTGLEESFKKFYGKDINDFRRALETRYIDYIDILWNKCKNKNIK